MWSVPPCVSFPGPLLRLACFEGGAVWSRFPPSWLGAVRTPWGGFVAFMCRGPGWGVGGGAACAPRPPFVRPGGLVGRGVALPRSGQATKRVSLASFWSWGAWPPYRSGLCSPAFSGRGPCGALARWRGLACSPRFLWEPAAGAGGRAVLRPLSRVGGGGDHPLCLGGAGAGTPEACGPLGLWGRGGSRRGLFAPPLGGGPRFPTLPYPFRRRTPPRRVRLVGVTGPPRGGGMRGGPWTTFPGAPSDLYPPSALPEWAIVMGGSWGARPPYCSGAPPCAAPRLCVQVQPHPPQVEVPSGGGGASPRLWGGGGSLLWPSSWGEERGEGGGAPLPRPAPPPRRASACHPLSSARPPGVYSCRGGCPAAVGVGRRPVGRPWVSAARGGREEGR